MARLRWNESGERYYEYGVSLGVLYVKKDILNDGSGTDYNIGVPWNGLISVEMDSEGFDGHELWSDEIMFDRLYSPEVAQGVITSYTYPKEFEECQGRSNITNGVWLCQQARKEFGFVYRTDIKNEYDNKPFLGADNHYKIHILYNCTAKPPEIEYDTLSDNSTVVEYTWEIDAVPVEFENHKPFTELIIDSRTLPIDKLTALVDTLFGGPNNNPTLLNPQELFNLIDTGEPIVPYPTGVVPVPLTVYQNGTYAAPDGYGYTPVSVSVSGVSPEPLTVSQNGTYSTPDGHGYTPVTVSVVDYDLFNKLAARTLSSTAYSPDLTSIGSWAFAACAIKSVYFPNCSFIDRAAFLSCIGLNYVDFPVCTTINPAAFSSCFTLKSVSFPACTTIEYLAFANCDGLMMVSFPACTKVNYNAFESCDSLSLASFPLCSYIGSYAFSGCSKLSSVYFPVCSYIGSYAFSGCSRLSSAYFPLCSYIGNYAFASCKSLAFVYFSDCGYIGNMAFSRCNQLLSLYIANSVVCSLATSLAFYSTPIAGYTELTDGRYGSIYVPESLVNSYKTAANWSYYSDRITALN